MAGVGNDFLLLASDAPLGELDCPRCGCVLEERHSCRWQCPRCGFLRDCSD